MRAAAIAVIAYNRFCKMISHPSYQPLAGVPLKIGRENFALAPSCIISQVTGTIYTTFPPSYPYLLVL